MEHAYWGAQVSNGEAIDFFRSAGVRYEKFEKADRLLDRVVDLIRQGKVIGWLQGRFEWGPRALGNRSILADPRNPQMKEIVNRKIKFREPFRPFAPSVLAQEARNYFDLPESALLPARFMLVVPPVRQEGRGRIPAVTHVDGTCRLQMVEESVNPYYAALIQRFGRPRAFPCS